uniref:CSON007480 protein n=1 Tax=Culicoides sonorensis TaxID=179676 RepID=A0A336LXI4_CULSO
MKHTYAGSVILLIFVACALAQDAKYCDPALCTTYTSAGYVTRPHIACPGNAPSNCPADAAAIPMDAAMQSFILQKHNSYRNALAGGTVNGFATAVRMPEMTWDPELSYIAAQNVMRCVYGHDQCRNTVAFKHAGQNIGSGTGYLDNKSFVTAIIDLWWNEYKVCTQAVLDKFFSTSGVVYGHFTAMSTDRSNKIGCAGVTYNGSTRIFACNYAYTNMIGEPIYVKGVVRSKCTSGASATYPNLCSASEPIRAVPIGA